jgi:diguanylate cyclase (GGDEF)-like protein
LPEIFQRRVPVRSIVNLSGGRAILKLTASALPSEPPPSGRPWRGPKLLSGILARLKIFLDIGQVPPDLIDRLYLDQATDFSKVITARAFVGICTAGLIAMAYGQTAFSVERSALIGAVQIIYVIIIALSWPWLRPRVVPADRARQFMRRAACLLFIAGMLWACIFYIDDFSGDLQQKLFTYGVMIGLISMPVLVAPLSAAIAFWLPVAVGALVSYRLSGQFDPFLFIDLLAYILLIGYCILYLNRRMNERAIGAIRLEENSELIKLLLRDFEENASDWLWETNAQLELQRVSARLAQVSRRPAGSIRGKFPEALLGGRRRAADGPGVDGQGAAIMRLNRLIGERAAFRDLVVPVTIAGEERFWSITGKPITDRLGVFTGYHGVGSDITGQKRQQEQIAFLARHDSLTKLPNRLLFNEALHEACETCAESGIALLCLDLDHFKLVNDTLGHPTGDGVLLAVAERLRGCLREVDIASRLGGDEFGIIVSTNDAAEAYRVATRVREGISRPYEFDGQLVQIDVSIGIAMAPRDQTTPSGLMKHADLALYRAKSEGRGTLRFYDPEMDERLNRRRALQSLLGHAVQRGELRVDYQPIVDVASRRIVGAEALLRWQHPDLGLLLPGQFIGLAEETGLIGPIGEWVLRQACKQAAGWPGDVAVAVNLSPLQFRDDALVASIDAALADAGLAPARLELEITETTMLETNAQTVEALWALHGRGVRIALDDFGTGYSSLSYLRRFPFDKIKIDRSFIRDLSYEKDDSSIIQAIIGLADRMNMIVTAEGVETGDQASLLASYGCAQAQGYLYHPPITPALFAQLLATQEQQKVSSAF